MGQKLSQQKISTDAKAFIRKYYPEYPYVEHLNDGIMNKSVIISSDTDQSPLVLKIFYKDNYDEKDKKKYEIELDKIKKLQVKLLSDNHKINVVPIINIKDNYRSGILYRQYIGISLRERIYLMPYLTYIDKVWITFQLLYLFNNLKNMQVYHGDLKPENILLTSNLSVYIADFATYKPAYIHVNDLASYTYYFGSYNSDNMKGCYLAPERLCDAKEIDENLDKNSSMDVFSLGLIIAELFLEKVIFDFTSLRNYKKGEISKKQLEDLLKDIKNIKIKNLILDMIKISPEERITIDVALKRFTEEICPLTMTGFLFHLNMIINKTEFWKPDFLIGFLYRYWETIWKLIYGPSSTPGQLFQRMNFPIINKLIADNPISYNLRYSLFKKDKKGIFSIDNYNLLFAPSDGKFSFEYKDESVFKKNNNEDCAFIIINLLLQNFQNVKYETSNYVAMEMLKNFCVKLPDITKLQLIIPYLVDNIKRTRYTTKLTSLNYIFEILYSFNFNNLILPVTEYNYFDSYIFPKILQFYEPKKPYLVLEFLNNIDRIIDLEMKFLNITLKSRIKRMNELINEEKNITPKSNKEKIDNKDEKYKEIIKKKNKRTEEIYNDYDNCLESFKNNLLNVIMDVIGSINEVDLLIITIRKLPCIIDFFGQSKSNEFSKFIINNFNNEWIIQKEILMQIPKMMNTLGKNVFENYILLCLEGLIGNNSNEFKTYRLIEVINKLLKMEILSPYNAIDFVLKLQPYSIHPNSLIHNQFLDLMKNLFNVLSDEEIFKYLQKDFISYLKIPYPYLTYDIIKDNYIKKVSRNYYLLKLENFDFIFPDNSVNNADNSLFAPNQHKEELLIGEIIEREKNGNLMANNNGEAIYIFNKENDKVDDTSIKKYSFVEPLNKYIKKEAKLNNMSGEELERKIFGKIFWLSSEKDRYKIPYIKEENFFSLEKNEERIPTELFQINYVLKTLCISIQLVKLNFLLDFNKNTQTSTSTPLVEQEAKISLGNFYYNKHFNGWRPQGRQMTTIYDHQRPIEKLVPMKNKSFCSFDSRCNPIIWKIKGKDDEFILKKKWSMNYNNEYSLAYRKTINYLDNLFFILGSDKSLYSINFISVPSTIDKICDSPDDSLITCTFTLGNSIVESQNILFTTENGSISLYDPRISGISLTNNLNKLNGIPYCISEFSSDQKYFLIGTLSGKLLTYDLRLNKVISELNYNNGTPILGMFLHKQKKDNVKNLLIWSGSDDYEVGLWKIDNYDISSNCDLLLKVNSIDKNDEETYEPMMISIPKIYATKLNNKNNINLKYFRKKVIKDFRNLNKYTYLYNTTSNRNLIYSKMQDELFFCKKTLNNLCNIYENPLTVQCVLSPLCGDNAYENAPYLLTGGNDRTIRYWDITKENKEYRPINSYIINTPTNMNDCIFKKYIVNRTTIFQSNEVFNSDVTKDKIPGFSDYQNYNGINYYSGEKNIYSGYSTRNLDVSHKSVITDLLSFNLNDNINEKPNNYLVSSSWDGTIKVWK